MRAEKQFLVDEVAAQLATSNYLLIANFTGVTVEDATLRCVPSSVNTAPSTTSLRTAS